MLDFFKKRPANVKNDVLSGLTVALALVPEAIAFAFVAGVSPIIGLYSAFFLGLITAVVGGRPGMISGATGAMAVVVVSLVAIHGVEYLFPTVMLCGLLQVLVGVGRLGKLIRMVPASVMLGFVNGLAIVIGLAQLGSFKTLGEMGDLVYLSGTPLVAMLGLVGLTMLIIWGLPKLTTAVPSSLVAILVVSGLAAGLNAAWDGSGSADRGPVAAETAAVRGSAAAELVPTVGSMLGTNAKAAAVKESLGVRVDDHGNAAAAGPTTELDPEQVQAAVAAAFATVDADPSASSISAGLPIPFFLDAAYETLPPISLATLWIIFPFALTLAGVGLIESLMTLTLIDEITDTRGRGNRECVGQGVANLTCGFFGGMGGCAMIGQSLINVNSGGRGRLSGVTAAVCLLAFVLFLAPWIEMISMAALVGVMFMVVIGTFEWASIKMARKMPRADTLVMILVAGYTVIFHDLATAVILGVAAAALVFAWQHATHLFADTKIEDNLQGGKTKRYQLHGPLFFASVRSFKELFDVANDPDDVVIDFYYTRVYDQSGLEAVSAISEKYQAAGKRVHLTHLSEECRRLLDKAGDLVEVNVSEDPQYHVATDRLG
ncbi:SulP family inorganic anion transporter [Phycisphaera mikurensis]|uniref:Putative sulfate transporter n=1 Tax=Phycisphaera mikurensis (strain NBRC 102666 / KCTC 22515 / FYK2301M01) TaxID=1142394 RepID=I0IGZ2_PHYMF|nr:SulP family inorganic anion transporter [Phycisphaera mikurensis]MBB6440787.1 SulP family sulfate permease [Phycisphaera mikurensis]BAM04530.1 putative sulfate transporter [Phycisphaera mikurensis NBRC 102666]